jgi:murein endopeptidase
VRQLIDLGEWWARTHPKRPRLGIGDLAQEHGGPFLGPVVGHVSHQNGLDVDIRLVRADGREAAVDPGSYDRALTQAVVDRLVAQGASLVLEGPSLDLTGPSGVVMDWPGHDDHLHARFPDPDGTGN